MDLCKEASCSRSIRTRHNQNTKRVTLRQHIVLATTQPLITNHNNLFEKQPNKPYNTPSNNLYLWSTNDYLRKFWTQHGENQLCPNLVKEHHNNGGFSSELLFKKKLSQSDVNKYGRLGIIKEYANQYLPCISGTKDEKLVIYDMNMRPWTFQYSCWKSNGSFVLKRNWYGFVKEKQLKKGDVVKFYACKIKGLYQIHNFCMIGTRSDNNGSLRSDDTRERVNGIVPRMQELNIPNKYEMSNKAREGIALEQASTSLQDEDKKISFKLFGVEMPIEQASLQEAEKKSFKLFGVQVFPQP